MVFNGRQQDCIEPLLHITDRIGSQVPQQARHVLIKSFQHDSEQGCFVQLLEDIHAIFNKAGTSNIPTWALLQSLNSMQGRPWSKWDNGWPMNPRDLGRILRPAGITSQSIRINSRVTLKGYGIQGLRSLVGTSSQLEQASR
jgi:hypothetical protein